VAIALSVPGYAKIRAESARGLVMLSCRAEIEQILKTETLYEFASRQEGARRFKGRTTAYGIQLGCGRAVVRHAMRGGILARAGSDLFLPPTRGLRELMNSLRLRVAGISTPEVVSFVSYNAGPLFRRSDVATREIPESHDLAVVLREMPDADHRESCLRATGRLLSLMARAGAHHPDLNARNVLITWDHDGASAHILDVDRIKFHVPSDPMVADANIQRLARSLRKLRENETLNVSDDDIWTIERAARERVT
jgi:3-deoxy-D-manno-octulosonic acid kinase